MRADVRSRKQFQSQLIGPPPPAVRPVPHARVFPVSFLPPGGRAVQSLLFHLSLPVVPPPVTERDANFGHKPHDGRVIHSRLFHTGLPAVPSPEPIRIERDANFGHKPHDGRVIQSPVFHVGTITPPQVLHSATERDANFGHKPHDGRVTHSHLFHVGLVLDNLLHLPIYTPQHRKPFFAGHVQQSEYIARPAVKFLEVDTEANAEIRARDAWESIIGGPKDPADTTEYLYEIILHPTPPSPLGNNAALVVKQHAVYMNPLTEVERGNLREASAMVADGWEIE